MNPTVKFFIQFSAMVLFVVTAAVLWVTLYVEPHQEQNRREFISQCQDQGGKYIQLRSRQYCLIDGVKFARF